MRRSPVALHCPADCGCEPLDELAWCAAMKSAVAAWLATSPTVPRPTDHLALPCEGPCHVGFGTSPSRYSYKSIGGRKRGLHRVALIVTGTAVAAGQPVDHRCRNTRCYSPLHIEPVTPAENTRRGKKARQTHCHAGHRFTPSNTFVRSNGTRQCLACTSTRRRRW